MLIRRLRGLVRRPISASRPVLYADALRHIRAQQLLHRPRRQLPMSVLAAGLIEREPAGWRPLAGALGVDPAPQSGQVSAPDSTGFFEAVGRRRFFTDSDAFWQPGNEGMLFAFQLQGFSELARYAALPGSPEQDAFWIEVIESWLAHHATPRLPGWHPFPTSGRIIAWCAALSRERWPPALEMRMLRSLTRQAALLRRSVEHDIGGNHVVRNATALLFAGICLGHRNHEQHALRLLERELKRQVLSDGGHEERSTAYHRAVLADLADGETLIDRAGRPVPPWLTGARQAMQRWDSKMRGPDGTLALLNDAWEGPAVPAPRTAGVTVLQPSGYVVMRHDEDQAILDVGPLAPDHLPPHAHADLLSFVLWGDGRPLIVDPGSFEYTGPRRRLFRSTSSHNTVEVDGMDQCVLWGDFRASFMPRVLRFEIDDRAGVIVAMARHDGYRRLDDPVIHERTFVWLPSDGLVIIDTLLAALPHDVRSRLHLAPGLRGSTLWAGPFHIAALGAGAAPRVVDGEYSPYLGVKQPIDVVKCTLRAEPQIPFGWSLLRTGARAMLADGHLRVERCCGETLLLNVSAMGGRDGDETRLPLSVPRDFMRTFLGNGAA